MGELSFLYDIMPTRQAIRLFGYEYIPTTEYTLSYQRYAALFDASIFNGPVVITKVATGLSYISNLFVDKKAKPFIDTQELFGDRWKPESSPEMSKPNANIVKMKDFHGDVIRHDTIFMEIAHNSDLRLWHNLLLKQRYEKYITSILAWYGTYNNSDDKSIGNNFYAESKMISMFHGHEFRLMFGFFIQGEDKEQIARLKQLWTNHYNYLNKSLDGVIASPIQSHKTLNKNEQIFGRWLPFDKHLVSFENPIVKGPYQNTGVNVYEQVYGGKYLFNGNINSILSGIGPHMYYQGMFDDDPIGAKSNMRIDSIENLSGYLDAKELGTIENLTGRVEDKSIGIIENFLGRPQNKQIDIIDNDLGIKNNAELDIIYQYLLERVNDDGMNIIYQAYLKKKALVSNILPNALMARPTLHLNLYQNILAKPIFQYKPVDTIYQVFGRRPDLEANKNDFVSISPGNKYSNVIQQIYASSGDKNGYIFSQIYVQSEEKFVDAIEQILAESDGKAGFASDQLAGSSDGKIGNAFSFDTGTNGNQSGNVFESLNGKSEGKQGNSFDILSGKSGDQYIQVSDILNAIADRKGLSVIDIIQMIGYGKLFNIIENFHCYADRVGLGLSDDISVVNDNKDFHVFDGFIMSPKGKEGWSWSEIFVNKDNHFGSIFDPYLAMPDGKVFSIFDAFSHNLMNVFKEKLRVNILENASLERKDEQRFANAFESLQVHKDQPEFSLFDTDSLVQKETPKQSIYATEGMAQKNLDGHSLFNAIVAVDKIVPEVSIFEQILAALKKDSQFSVLTAGLFAEREEKIATTLNLFGFYKPQQEVFESKEVSAFRDKLRGVSYSFCPVIKSAKETIEDDGIWGATGHGEAQKEAFEVSGDWISPTIKNVLESESVALRRPGISSYIITTDTFFSKTYPTVVTFEGAAFEKENSEAFTTDEVYLSSIGKTIDRYQGEHLSSEGKIVDETLGVFLGKPNQFIMMDSMESYHGSIEGLNKPSHQVFESDPAFFTKGASIVDAVNGFFVGMPDNILNEWHPGFQDVSRSDDTKNIYEESPIFTFRDKIKINALEQIFMCRPDHTLVIYKDNELFGFMYNDGLMLNNRDMITMFTKMQGTLVPWDNNTYLEKDRYNMSLEDTVSMSKKDYDMYLVLQAVALQKIRQSMNLKDDMFLAKESYSMDLELNMIWVNKDSGDMLLMPWFGPITKDKHSIEIFKQTHSLIKDRFSIPDTINMDSLFKTIASAMTSTQNQGPNWEDIAGMIVPVSKTKNQAFVDHITALVDKSLPTNIHIKKDTFASVLSRDTAINLDLPIDKKSFGAFIDYENEMLTKINLRGAIFSDTMISIHKPSIDTKIDDTQVLIDRVYREAMLSVPESLWIHRLPYDVSIEEGGLSITRLNQRTTYLDQVFLERIPYLCYYDYGRGEWADKPPYPIQVEIEHEWSHRKSYKIVLDFMTPAIRKNVPVFFTEYFMAEDKFRNVALAEQLEWLEKTRRKCGIHPNDFGNWAWVYESPDPFTNNPYSIDELLLPEVDTVYENFEDIIFDKTYMRPRNPVREIDETTFVAKFPIKHPIKKYQEVGLDYDAGAIKLHNYFGVETDVMHTMFLRFYRIWQAKVFEFATMTMQQAVNQMLEYLFAWIPDYYPIEQQEQAYRVFRLIRWYGEAAIIRNSQYIVSYEYDTLKSMLTTGECAIPNDLHCSDPVNNMNDTMFVDGSLGVIRNNPAYLNADAYVEFYIENKRNTTFTFSLANTIGSVNIYINDKLVDTQSRSVLNLVYPIQFTGDVNIVRIEKKAAHNLNANFYIGNIMVENMSFKNLTIEFDPQLKAGNKPLNEIAIKIVQYANLREDRDRAYEEGLKSNLGLSEMYKKLLEYWNLHHHTKIKGKRLTIKEI